MRHYEISARSHTRKDQVTILYRMSDFDLVLDWLATKTTLQEGHPEVILPQKTLLRLHQYLQGINKDSWRYRHRGHYDVNSEKLETMRAVIKTILQKCNFKEIEIFITWRSSEDRY